MAQRWIVNSAKTVGSSHTRDNIPCQDSVLSRVENGVTVIALSDGCGSAPLSQYGADITVNALCELLTHSFDALYESDALTVKKAVVAKIMEGLKGFARDNAALITEVGKKQPRRYEVFKSEWRDYSLAETLYPLTLLDATVQFVAVKDGRMIVGRLGDGIIGDISNGALRILSSEDKVGVAGNATWYPTTVLLVEENPYIDPWENFEIIKGEDASAYEMLMIVSDGVGDVVCRRSRTASERSWDAYLVEFLLENADGMYDILEKHFKPLKNIDDDLSVIVMQRPNVKIERKIYREYDEEGRTIANSRAEKVVPIEEQEEPVEEQRTVDPNVVLLSQEETFSLNLLDEDTNKRIEAYLDDASYRAFFIEQVSKIKQHLETRESEQLGEMLRLLQPGVDGAEWKLLLRHIFKLKLFEVDKKGDLISRKGI